MPDPEPIKSTSPDPFLRQNKLEGDDASSQSNADKPLKSQGDLDTLYQPKESTTRETNSDTTTTD